ncbi:MAG: hypothetical protein IMY67_11850 [Bacteroidetes bacterium]|nr:hypothetical protein [Bacteroidota bacterium]
MTEILAEKNNHNKYAPYWALTLFILCGTGIATISIDLGSFWKGYVLDMVAPAWNYILFRGLFTYKTNNIWTRFFTPLRTLIIFLVVCFLIEFAQYLNLYDATYDVYDLLAYLSILVPLFIFDVIQSKE